MAKEAESFPEGRVKTTLGKETVFIGTLKFTSSILVGGVVHGDIEAVEKIELLPSAKVYGNIRTAKLRIADGVVFEGKCEMIRNPASIDIFSGTKEQVKGSMKL
jgi:cytoskeletal protein CcmA (bactofilin family)